MDVSILQKSKPDIFFIEKQMGVCVFLVSKMKSSWMHVCVVQETSLNFVQVCCVEKKASMLCTSSFCRQASLVVSAFVL